MPCAIPKRVPNPQRIGAGRTTNILAGGEESKAAWPRHPQTVPQCVVRSASSVQRPT